MSIRDALTAARNIAHDSAAVVGFLTGSTGAVVLLLNSLGVHVGAEQVAGVLTAAGYATTIASKAIDSLNDALRPTPTVTVTQRTGSQTVITHTPTAAPPVAPPVVVNTTTPAPTPAAPSAPVVVPTPAGGVTLPPEPAA